MLPEARLRINFTYFIRKAQIQSDRLKKKLIWRSYSVERLSTVMMKIRNSNYASLITMEPVNLKP